MKRMSMVCSLVGLIPHLFIYCPLFAENPVKSLVPNSSLLPLNERRKVIQGFDDSLKWISDNLLFDKTHLVDDLHPLAIKLKPIDKTIYTNLPKNVELEAENTLFGTFIVAVNDQKTIYASPSRDFLHSQKLECSLSQNSPVCLKEVSTVPDYFYLGNDGTQLQFRYSFINYQTEYANSLAYMYDNVANIVYLKALTNQVEAIAHRLPKDGRYVRKLPSELNSAPKYTGMAQGLVLLAFDAYEKRRHQNRSRVFEAAYIRASRNFEHTTEGVRNHWVNSKMGEYLSNMKKMISSPVPQGYLADTEIYYEQAKNCGGRIPYDYSAGNNGKCLDPNIRKKSYVSYDTVLLTRLASLYPKSLLNSSAWGNWKVLFPATLEISTTVKNSGIYAARHMEALARAKHLWQYKNDSLAYSYLDLYLSSIENPPKDLADAQARLSMAGPLLDYFQDF